MFNIKGLRTFAMSAKDLDKAETFYTKVLGGEVVRRVTPTEEQLKAGTVRSTRYGCGNDPTSIVSKEGFQLLHQKYLKSEWTKKTFYWF